MNNHRSGFTLIELLIVLVVLGILFVMGLFLFNDVRGASHNTAAKADARGALMKATSGYVQNQHSFGSTTAEAISQLEALDTDGLSYTDNNGSLTSRQIFVQLDDATTGYPGPVGQQITVCSQSETGRVFCLRSNQEQAFPVSNRDNSGDTALLINTSTNIAYAQGPNVPDTVCALPQPGSSLNNPWPPLGCEGELGWGNGMGPVPTGAFMAGPNGSGQLGDGTNTHSNSAYVAVDSVPFDGRIVTSLSVGQTHSCAISRGDVYCWGRDDYGKLGNGGGGNSNIPVLVEGSLDGRSVSAVTAGQDHTCAIADGEAYCWGRGTDGRLGQGVNENSNVPVAVAPGVHGFGGSVVTDISAGQNHTCAIADDAAYCWGGHGTSGALGHGGSSNSNVPRSVFNMNENMTSISAGSATSCAVSDGELFCWGANGSGKMGNTSAISWNVEPLAVNMTGAMAGTIATHVSVGDLHVCAIASGNAYCWGANSTGQLGDGTGLASNVPVAVNTDAFSGSVSRLDVGQNTLAISAGEVFQWGFGDPVPVATWPYADSQTRQALIVSAADLSGNTGIVAVNPN